MYKDGKNDERERVLKLIDEKIEEYAEKNYTRIILQELKQKIEEVK